jgi:3-oxoadipate enol-lactonase
MPELLNHRLAGADRSFALLLIHPLGAQLGFWDDFTDALGGRATTLACDLRCSGKSPGAVSPPTLAELAADLEAVRTELGIERVVPIGCAVGSMVAASYAAAYPESTAALVLSNPTPRSSEQAQRMLSDRAAIVARDGMQAILPGAVERAFLNQPQDDRYRRYYDMFAGQHAQAYALSALGAAGSDATAALKSLRCRTLLVPGRHDVLLPLEHAYAVRNLVPQAGFVIAETAAHFVPYQAPDVLADLAAQFIGR